MKPLNVVEEVKKPRRKRKANRFQKPVFEEAKLGKNNFVNDRLRIPFVFSKNEEEQSEIVDGEIKRNKIKLEYIPFTKLFLKHELQQDVIELSLRSKEMLLYIMYNLPRTKDCIAIFRKEYMELHNIKTEVTYLGAVKELCKLNFIAHTNEVRDVFWINPYYFFQGNRLRKYPNNIFERGVLMDMEDAEDNQEN